MNVVSTQAPSFLIGSYSFLILFILAGNMDSYKSLDGFEIQQDEPGSMELAALKCLKKSP